MYPSCLQCNIPKRFIIVVMVFISYLYHYYLHTNIGMAVVSMTSPKLNSNSTKPEFEWNSKERALVISSLDYGRLLGPIGGVFAEKFGGSTFYYFIIIFTSAITLLTPFILHINFYSFILANAGVGILEAFTTISYFQLWSRWAPPNERSTFISFSVIGYCIGSIVSFLVSSYILKTYSWPILYYISGAVGFIFFGIWFMVVSDDPEKDKHISKSERKFITEQINSPSTEKLIYPWRQICTSPSVLIVSFGKFSVACGFSFVVGNLPQFIKDVSNLEIDKIGFISTIPMIFAFISMPMFGYLFSWIRKKNMMSLTKLHRRFGAIPLFLGGCVTVLLSMWPSLTGSIICISTYLFVTSMFLVGSQTLMLDFAPRYAAFLNGIMNVFYTLGSIFSPIFVGFIVTDHSLYQWNICFIIFSVFHFVSAVFYFKFVSGELQSWANYKLDETEKDLEPPALKE